MSCFAGALSSAGLSTRRALALALAAAFLPRARRTTAWWVLGLWGSR